ncbi:hypothetical protein AB0L40_22420 [Patulibacter sp. NPDC049589]|uniref:hypothetical protein n=1 Tax=Patulibacter sp. NPDC049589 TaxID=3154731 RepID=UPI003437D330
MQRPMPDFAEALERHLRDAAAEIASPALVAAPVPSARPRPRWRVGRGFAAAGSLAFVAVVVAIVLIASGSGTKTAPAFGEPLVLRTPLVPLPKVARPGSSAAQILGPESATITRGHEIPTSAGPAYLYGNAAGQCLTVPDPASPEPAVERGVTCLPAAELGRFGITLVLGTDDESFYVAAIPQGVRAPVLRTESGETRTLEPSGAGVVTVKATEPSVVTRFDRDGATREDALAQPPGYPVVPAPPPSGNASG